MKPFLRSVLLTLPMALLTLPMLTRGKPPSGPSEVAAIAATFIFFTLSFFLMVHTGKTDRYRAPVFIAYAVAFTISFISHLIEARGSMALTEAAMLSGKTPFCHIVIPMTLIPAALTRTIIFPGTIIGGYASVASMFVLWIGASLSLGRGFCGWACFFGGLDDGFSRIFRTPFIKKVSPVWKYLPWAVLLAVVLMAAVTLSPTYCMWLCPFKTTTEYVEITSLKTLVQAIIFVSLFVALVVVLPVLTKRRTQCGLFCPMGAFQSLTNKANVFDIRIDKEKCVECGRCMQVCPTFSMDEKAIVRGRSGLTCMKCGRCVDACPKKAIYYHVKGTPLLAGRESYRLLFLYPAFLFLATMAGGNIKDTVMRLIKLVATGSLI